MVVVLLLSGIGLAAAVTLKSKMVVVRHVVPFGLAIQEHLRAAVTLKERRIMTRS
jgi:hypothetical protein